MKPKILVVVGSIRSGRRGKLIAQWLIPQIEADGRFDVELADLFEYDLPFSMEFTEPSQYKDKNYPNPKIQKWSKQVDNSDAVIFIIPEYNHAVTAGLKNAIDQIYWEWIGKPVSFVGYGTNGASDAIDSLSHTVTALKWTVAQPLVRIKQVKKVLGDDAKIEEDEYYREQLAQMLGVLAKLVA